MIETQNSSEVPEQPKPEDLLGPPKTDIVSVGLSTLSSLVAGFVGGLVILVCTALFLKTAKVASPGIFPYVLALVGFFAILLSTYLTLFLNNLVFPNKYREGLATFAQTFALSILIFILVAPLYVYVGARYPDRLILVFTFHTLMSAFGVSLVSEILSNYRYALLSVYSSFAGFFAASAVSVAFFQNFTESDAALYSLVGAIIVVMVVTNALRLLAEFAYYQLYRATGLDPLGDVYARIENEERESLAKAERELTRFE
jgi:hypothetical protein